MCQRLSASVRMPSCCQESLPWANTRTRHCPSCTQSPLALSRGPVSTGLMTSLALPHHRSSPSPSLSVFQSRYVPLLLTWVSSVVQTYVYTDQSYNFLGGESRFIFSTLFPATLKLDILKWMLSSSSLGEVIWHHCFPAADQTVRSLRSPHHRQVSILYVRTSDILHVILCFVVIHCSYVLRLLQYVSILLCVQPDFSFSTLPIKPTGRPKTTQSVLGTNSFSHRVL